MIALKPSFSYTNERPTDESFMLKLKRNKVEDGELGIFGAEKYFEGALDEERLRASDDGVYCGPNQLQEKHEEPCSISKPTTPSSVRSESSWNSRKGLLAINGSNGNNHNKKTGVKSLLACLGCNCNDKDSVNIMEAKQRVKGGASGHKTNPLLNKRADEDVNIKIEDCFTFPVLNPIMADVKHTEPLEVKHEREQEGKKSISLERKLAMLNWDGANPRAEILDMNQNEAQIDTESEGSSDLFELESFSTNENNLFLPQLDIENNRYEPSEASVDWSVVTASAADFSTHEDTVESRHVKGSGILSGCKSLKAVRVSGDGQGIANVGEKAAAIVPPVSQEWCNRLGSATRVAKIQADTKLICAGSGLHTSQKGFGVACQVHRMHSTHASSHHLYMKQQ